MPVSLTTEGLLPPGLHLYSRDEVGTQFATSPRRIWLWSNLLDFLPQSQIARASHELWIDGSFVEAKEEPSDIDVLFIQERKKLNESVLDEIERFSKPDLRAKLKASKGIDFNQTAVDDEMYPDFFQNWFGNHYDWESREPQPVPKGIVLVKL